MDLFTYLMVKKGHKLSTNDEFSYLLGRGNQEYTTKIGTSIDVKGSVASPMTIELKPHELTQDETPTPENPQEVHVVTGDNTIHVSNGKTTTDYSINLGSIEYCKIDNYEDEINKSTGKNLLYEYHKTSNNIYFNDTNVYEDYIFPAGTYTLSYVSSESISTIIKDDTGTQTNLGAGTTKTFTTSHNFNVFLYKSGITIDMVKNVMLEQGSKATEYEPYGTDWYIKKEIGKVVLDGSEDWAFQYNTTGRWCYKHTISDILYPNSTATTMDLYCNYYTKNSQDKLYINDNTNPNYVDYGICVRGNNPDIIIKNNDVTTVADFKTWLSTHNTTVYYILATPTYTKITDETLILHLETTMNSKDKRTIITQTNDDLPFIIKATIKIK